MPALRLARPPKQAGCCGEEHILLTFLRTSVCTISYNSYSAAIL